ncbi:MAG: amidase [Solirubrobacteraceae bacterium]
MTDELASMDATAQAELVRGGEASPAELVEAAIERIEALNPELNAVIHPLFAKARDAATGGLGEGPFRGVPIVVKDLGPHTAGDPFHAGTKFAKEAGWTEAQDSELITRFRRAGFVLVAKTNTPELGILPTTEPEAYGPARNPWALERSTGGSSGGSAGAVASGMVPLAHANDGGGSIRIPASSCGLLGLKPTRGRTTLAPDFGDLVGGLVSDHVVCRSVRDCAAVLDAIAGPALGDPYVAPPPQRPFVDEVGADPGRLRIGMMTTPPGKLWAAHPDVVAATEDAGRLLESLGHGVEPDAYPPELDDLGLVASFLVRWTSGIAWWLKWWEARLGREIGPDDVEACTWALAELARSHTGADFLVAIEKHQLAGRSAARWHEGFDLLLTPTMGEPPTRIGEYAPDPENPAAPIVRATPIACFTAGANMTGQPAVSLPLHWNEEGLPIGVQFVAPFGREDLLVRVAAQLEEARPWAQREPGVWAGRAPA